MANQSLGRDCPLGSVESEMPEWLCERGSSARVTRRGRGEVGRDRQPTHGEQ